MISNEIKERIRALTERLDKALDEQPKSFDDVENIESNGVYIVIKNSERIYVGSSTTSGHKRMADLTSHWSNHTLHNKLLTEEINKKFGLELKRIIWCKKGKMNKNCKENLIHEGKFTEEQFKEIDERVKNEIKKFSYVFIDLSDKRNKEIKFFEHFTISVLNPPYND